MNREDIYKQIKKKESFLCVGLDTDLNKIPTHLLNMKDPVFEFNKRIIDATWDKCISYKINLAFYESLGPDGLESMKNTIDYIPKEAFLIADAKRGDIGNTSQMYAKTFFDYYGVDSITLSPYMGKDSVTPYLEYPDKWVILLALTSNMGSQDFQMLNTEEGRLYETVIRKSSSWGTPDQIMYVTGATQASYISDIRKIIPENFLLVPGVGAQGGDLEKVTKNGINSRVGLIVNVSRSILYASNEMHFYQAASEKAREIQTQMKEYLSKYG